MEEKKVKLIQLLALFTRHRKLFLINFFLLCSITAVYSLVMPKWFKATATILPPSDSGLFDFSSLLSSLPVNLSNLSLGGVSGNASIYLAILNSRTTMEEVAKKFDLQKRYEQENLEDTIRRLRQLVTVNVNDDGTINLSVEANTPFLSTEEEENEARKLAADMANYFIETLGKTNTSLRIQKARNNRIYIEDRYRQNVADLKKAEEALQAFQKQSGTIALPEQTEATIKAAAELQAQIIFDEVQAGVLRNTVAKDHPKLAQLELQLKQLRARMQEFMGGPLTDGDHSAKSDQKMELYIPFHDIPDLGVQYIRLLREVKLQEKLMEYLLPVYEQAKIEEAKDLPTVQVLDKAVPPIRRDRPKRTIMVLVAGLISIFISAGIVFTLDYLTQLRESQTVEYSQLIFVLDELARDLKNLKNRVLLRKR